MITCWFIGHKGWFGSCERCGAPLDDTPESPFDEIHHSLLILSVEIRGWLNKHVVCWCLDCKKPNYVWGKPYGNHDQCFPF